MNQILGPEDRYIFKARYWEDRTLKEIAAELGLTEENVRVRHWRAKKRLRKACKIYRASGLL
jgi:RNA polymerase sigma factor (sigma-70 family)